MSDVREYTDEQFKKLRKDFISAKMYLDEVNNRFALFNNPEKASEFTVQVFRCMTHDLVRQITTALQRLDEKKVAFEAAFSSMMDKYEVEARVERETADLSCPKFFSANSDAIYTRVLIEVSMNIVKYLIMDTFLRQWQRRLEDLSGGRDADWKARKENLEVHTILGAGLSLMACQANKDLERMENAVNKLRDLSGIRGEEIEFAMFNTFKREVILNHRRFDVSSFAVKAAEYFMQMEEKRLTDALGRSIFITYAKEEGGHVSACEKITEKFAELKQKYEVVKNSQRIKVDLLQETNPLTEVQEEHLMESFELIKQGVVYLGIFDDGCQDLALKNPRQFMNVNFVTGFQLFP